MLAACAACYGAAVGSLVPRAVYRFAVPPELPRHGRCPAGHPLTGPAGGWLGTARCPECAPSAGPYGPGAGLFATTGALVCAGIALFTGARPELAVWLLAVPMGLLLAAVDLRVKRLPDVLTLPLAAATVALLGLAALLPQAGGSWTRALLGAAVLACGHFVLFLVNPRGMGFGDVKLALTLGAALGWYGWDVLFAGTFLSFLLAAGYGSALLLTKRAGRKSAIPFGPFMVLGTLGGILLGGLAV
ncbi:hypothetical protein DB35_12375 [Streptomyces abyssalis]|uniref:Prepilin type IV endopeptidase peptidase domain-containing protein n=1 Tax=Streptomyces abyssalis TaxID=933944 RepID=A0A1E7JIT2_9ACTN|nr:A24 family peptidase [Streptomyces abyssalis]OEU86371.1 hypothetical protein AN215_25570 [Streptomyces abyssalis]OEU93275.1 hypothetical protein DB35_12375 [Streptomyces abyssalis]